MQKRIKQCILIFLVCLSLTGCGYKDIDKRFFAVAIGIDYVEDNEETPYTITLALAVPSTKIEPKASITQIEKIEATNISDGLRQIKSKLDKELDLGHCKVIILGEALANHDVTDAIYWIARRRDVQNIAAVAIGKPDASAIINVQPESDRFPGNTLNFFFSGDTTESSYTYITRFTEMFKRIKEPGLDPILPIIAPEGESTFVVNSIALLDKQKVKLVLSPRETQLFNQLSNHLNHMSIYGSYEYENVTVAINKIKTKYKINAFDAQPTTHINVVQSVILEEMPVEMRENNDTRYASVISQLEKEYSRETTALFEKIRNEKIDPYGFGLRYRAKHPITKEQFEEVWPELYEDMSFNVNTRIELKSTGLIK